MNLINEQSVTTSTITITTTTATTTTTAKELSPAQASSRRRRVVRTSLESSLAAENTAASPSLSLSSLPAAEAAASLSFESIARSSIPCTAAKSSTSLVESINRQIEKISNSNLNSNIDAYQLNLIKKMPATITKTAVTASQSVAAGVAAVAASVGSNTTTTVSDVSDGMKNRNGNGDNSAPTTTTTPTTPTEKERKIGCEHYKRRAMFVTPCCNKFYKCRYCHDEKETHHFDRKTLTELICVECNTRQKVQEQCEKCGVRFGKYTCLICNLFDDEDKNQYHCDDCGICRIGGRENFFHCEVCNMCLPIELKIQGHRCVENISRSNCPVCLGAIHTSRIPCHIPDCGHLLHKMCFDQLLASGHYVCPTCQTSLLDMTKMWEYLDAQALLMAVPKKYENQRVYIFCNDCHETCKTKFHFVGLKCIHCGGYNTTQDVKRRMSWANGADSSTSA